MEPSQPKHNGHQKHQMHGLHKLKRAVSLLGGRTIDRRYRVGKALAAWRDEIIADLGGNDNISAQERTIIDACVGNKLLLNSVDVWLSAQPSLINTRKRQLYPIVLQRQQLQDSLIRGLTTLGLKRVIRTKTLDQILAEDDENGEQENASR